MGSKLLLEAFEQFQTASHSLERVHQELSRKVLQLSRRLEEKNRELERNLAEKEQIRQFLDTVMAHLTNGVLVLDADGVVQAANPAFGRLFPPGRPGPGPGDGLPDPLREALRPASPVVGPVEVGVGERRFLVTGTDFRPPGGLSEWRLFVFQDITELRRLQREEEGRARLAAMGEMAIQLAHEIRNPLGGIGLYLSMLREVDGLPGEARQWLGHVAAGIGSINYIVSNMLQFHRPLRLQPEWLAPGPVLGESVALLRPVAEALDVALELTDHYAGEVIEADREMLKQLGMNLLRNALNAIGQGGRVDVRLDGPVAHPRQPLRPAVRLEVADTGLGMDEEEQARMFEPGWSATRGGQGIGLWVSRQIINQHDGDVSVDSRRGGGTRVTVHLPVALGRG